MDGGMFMLPIMKWEAAVKNHLRKIGSSLWDIYFFFLNFYLKHKEFS